MSALDYWDREGRFGDNFGIPGVPMLPPDSSKRQVPLELPKDVIRVGEGSIWSSHRVTGNLSNRVLKFFQGRLGQAAQGYTRLTIGETNVRESGRIPNGQGFVISDIACIVKPVGNTPLPVQILQSVYSHSCLVWDFLSTEISIAPVALVGAGGGIFGVGAGNPLANDLPVVSNGSGATWVYRRNPVLLPPATVFAISQRFGLEAAPPQVPFVLQLVIMGRYKQAIDIG